MTEKEILQLVEKINLDVELLAFKDPETGEEVKLWQITSHDLSGLAVNGPTMAIALIKVPREIVRILLEPKEDEN